MALSVLWASWRWHASTMAELFVKTWKAAPRGFFCWEAAGLGWLAEARSVGGPAIAQVVDVSATSLSEQRVMACPPTAAAARAFGAQLARLHDAGANGWGAPPPGWRGDGFIGRKTMACRPVDSWGRFYVEERVLPFLIEAERIGGIGVTDAVVVREACDIISDGAFDSSDTPARIHGDLWSGNVLWSPDGVVLIDPAAHGGHRETDIAMLAVFGVPFFDEIVDGYQTVHPLGRAWRARIPVHQLHPLAVHAAGQGPGYGDALVRAARQVLALAL